MRGDEGLMLTLISFVALYAHLTLFCILFFSKILQGFSGGLLSLPRHRLTSTPSTAIQAKRVAWRTVHSQSQSAIMVSLCRLRPSLPTRRKRRFSSLRSISQSLNLNVTQNNHHLCNRNNLTRTFRSSATLLWDNEDELRVDEINKKIKRRRRSASDNDTRNGRFQQLSQQSTYYGVDSELLITEADMMEKDIQNLMYRCLDKLAKMRDEIRDDGAVDMKESRIFRCVFNLLRIPPRYVSEMNNEEWEMVQYFVGLYLHNYVKIESTKGAKIKPSTDANKESMMDAQSFLKNGAMLIHFVMDHGVTFEETDVNRGLVYSKIFYLAFIRKCNECSLPDLSIDLMLRREYENQQFPDNIYSDTIRCLTYKTYADRVFDLLLHCFNTNGDRRLRHNLVFDAVTVLISSGFVGMAIKLLRGCDFPELKGHEMLQVQLLNLSLEAYTRAKDFKAALRVLEKATEMNGIPVDARVYKGLFKALVKAEGTDVVTAAELAFKLMSRHSKYSTDNNCWRATELDQLVAMLRKSKLYESAYETFILSNVMCRDRNPLVYMTEHTMDDGQILLILDLATFDEAVLVPAIQFAITNQHQAWMLHSTRKTPNVFIRYRNRESVEFLKDNLSRDICTSPLDFEYRDQKGVGSFQLAYLNGEVDSKYDKQSGGVHLACLSAESLLNFFQSTKIVYTSDDDLRCGRCKAKMSTSFLHGHSFTKLVCGSCGVLNPFWSASFALANSASVDHNDNSDSLSRRTLDSDSIEAPACSKCSHDLAGTVTVCPKCCTQQAYGDLSGYLQKRVDAMDAALARKRRELLKLDKILTPFRDAPFMKVKKVINKNTKEYFRSLENRPVGWNSTRRLDSELAAPILLSRCPHCACFLIPGQKMCASCKSVPSSNYQSSSTSSASRLSETTRRADPRRREGRSSMTSRFQRIDLTTSPPSR